MLEFKKTGDRNLLYLEAAGGVIAEYLHKNYFDKNTDPFLGAREVNAQGDIWYGFPLRVILIGETLFLLRNCKGFPEICHRLQTRGLRSAYYEMLAAKIFARAGFDIEMWRETQQIGNDFDFRAVRKRLAINVEVTALEEKEFYKNTAINAIHRKRRQLPKDKPAVIFCVVPAQWEKLSFDINDWTADVANTFFLSGSRRVNRLVFYTERHTNASNTQSIGGFITLAKTYDNPNPYFPCNLDHIFEVRGRSELLQLLIEDSVENPERANALAKNMRVGEFYEWVDSFHDEWQQRR
jgi:hypothetical protein